MQKNEKKKILFCSLSFILCAAAAFPLCRLFLPLSRPALLLCFLSALVFAPILPELYAAAVQKEAVYELLNYLQSLLTHINSGNTLRVALYRAAGGRKKHARFSRSRKAYRDLMIALENNLALSELQPLLQKIFPCPESNLFYALLQYPEEAGEHSAGLFSRFEQSLRQLREAETSLAADRAKALSESLSLALMPALILLFLRLTAPDFLETAYTSQEGLLLLGGAYLLFLASVLLIRKIFRRQKLIETKASAFPLYA